jgi:hypothetical protein
MHLNLHFVGAEWQFDESGLTLYFLAPTDEVDVPAVTARISEALNTPVLMKKLD